MGINKIVVNTFSVIPKEIDGAGCSFYLTKMDKKKEKYILVNDFAEFAFMTINGKGEKFKLKSNKQNPETYIYSNKTYQLVVTIKKKKEVGYESVNNEGTLKLKKGNDEISINFIGECGD